MFCMGATDNDSVNQHKDTFLVLLLDENKIHVLWMSFTPVQNTSQKLHHTSGQNSQQQIHIKPKTHTKFSLSSRSNSETHNSQTELTIILCVVEDSLCPMIHFACRPSPSINNQTAIGRQLPQLDQWIFPTGQNILMKQKEKIRSERVKTQMLCNINSCAKDKNRSSATQNYWLKHPPSLL